MLELQGALTTPNGLDRSEGFSKTLNELAPKVQIIQRPTEWTADMAADAAQNVLTQNPNLAGIFMASELMATAINAQLNAAGKGAAVGEEGNVIRIAIDGTPQGLQLIRDKALDATVSQPLSAYATKTAELIELVKGGGTIEVGKLADLVILDKDPLKVDPLTIKDIKVFDTFRSAIAIESVDGAIIENIAVSNIEAINTGNAIFIRLGQRSGDKPGSIKNVSLKNIKVQVPFGRPDSNYDLRGPEVDFFHNPFPSSIVGLEGYAVENVTLENIEITYPGRASKGMAYFQKQLYVWWYQGLRTIYFQQTHRSYSRVS